MEKQSVRVAGDKLTIPAYYERAKKAPDGFKGAIPYVFTTENASCLVLLSHVKDDGSLVLDRNQMIQALHDELLGDNQGIIEVEVGELENRPYLYAIVKTLEEDDGMPLGVRYAMTMDIAKKKGSTRIIGYFNEEGFTGMRDSLVFAMVPTLSPCCRILHI